MSRTKRTDKRKTDGKRPDFVFEGLVMRKTPEWEYTRDRKRRNKSPAWYKKMKEQKRRSQRNQEIKNLRAANIEPEEINSPKEPRSNDWNWT